MSNFQIIRPGLSAAPEETPALPQARRRTEHFADYIFSDELATAVNVAIHLGKPLLLTGEPGTGKTALAWAVSRQIAAGEVLEFHAKSTSTAQDLLYSVDNLRRFHDSSAGSAEGVQIENYITWQPLGQAILSEKTRVLLIDEIDKAPRDFPNDLLNELDRMSFAVPELGPDVRHAAKAPHVVIITSNSERRLPMPFLRRCVYHHIPFPGTELLMKILEHHTQDLKLSESFLSLVLQRFTELRQTHGLTKTPATEELISWTRVLQAMGVPESQLEPNVPLGQLPGLEALIKLQDDKIRVKGMV